jgi:site-specific recombinase XerD
LFVGTHGERITRGTLQYRVLRAIRRAGIDAERAHGALVHGLRHTFATELANAEVSVYTLMRLLGHESMATLATLCGRRRHRNQTGGRPEQDL